MDEEQKLDTSYLLDLGGEEEDSMSKTFRIMADARSKQLSIPRSNAFSRKQVINAFQDSFELIGGVPRLAAWAHEHPTEFFKLYAKLLGGHLQVDVDNSGVIKVIHAIAPGPLDRVPVQGEVVDGEFTSEAPQVHDETG